MELYNLNKSIVELLEGLQLDYNIIDDISINSHNTITIDIQKKANSSEYKDIEEYNFYTDIYIISDKKSKKKLYEDSSFIKKNLLTLEIEEYLVGIDIISETIRNYKKEEDEAYIYTINLEIQMKKTK